MGYPILASAIPTRVESGRSTNRRLISVATARTECRHLARLTRWLATPEDRRYAKRHRKAGRQAQSLAARVLLRAVLETSFGVPGADWVIGSDARGRKFAAADAWPGRLSVSLAHSRGRAACAVSGAGSIGVDIEFRRRDRHLEALAEYAFTESEIDQVRSDGVRAFYRIWTMREAVAKASGAGLAATLRRCVLKTAPFSDKASAVMAGENFELKRYRLADPYSLSVAVQVDR